MLSPLAKKFSPGQRDRGVIKYLGVLERMMFFEDDHAVKSIIFGAIRCCYCSFAFNSSPGILIDKEIKKARINVTNSSEVTIYHFQMGALIVQGDWVRVYQGRMT